FLVIVALGGGLRPALTGLLVLGARLAGHVLIAALFRLAGLLLGFAALVARLRAVVLGRFLRTGGITWIRLLADFRVCVRLAAFGGGVRAIRRVLGRGLALVLLLVAGIAGLAGFVTLAVLPFVLLGAGLTLVRRLLVFRRVLLRRVFLVRIAGLSLGLVRLAALRRAGLRVLVLLCVFLVGFVQLFQFAFEFLLLVVDA